MISRSERPLASLLSLGVVPYATAHHWQHQMVDRRRQNPHLPDVLMLMEHPPVYTLGQGATLTHLKFAPDRSPAELHRVERGGEVTYHAPGQLVGYPILNLRRHQPDLHWYLRQLEEVIIRAIAAFGLQGDRVEGLTGVWVDGCKVAAVGIKVSRWITMHGFAVNVNPDLKGFEAIVPCGIADKPVGSLHQFCPDIHLEQVRTQVIDAFGDVFQLTLKPTSLDEGLLNGLLDDQGMR